MTKKLSHKDKKDWQKFIESSEKLDNKEKELTARAERLEKTIDLHGFTLEEANSNLSDLTANSFSLFSSFSELSMNFCQSFLSLFESLFVN